MSTKTLADAIRERRHEQLQVLLKEYPSLANTPDEDGEYPLHHTATHGNVEAARMLIAAGASVHARERSLHTPLSWAIVEGTHKVARLLIENGATYDLWVAAALGNLQKVRTFFTPDGNLVSNASVHGSSHNGADGHLLPKPPDTDGGVLSDAFYIACTNGRTEVARFLMEQGRRTELPIDLFGLPLHAASRFGHRETVMLLLSLGADRSTLDRHGKTPREVAVAAGNINLAELL